LTTATDQQSTSADSHIEAGQGVDELGAIETRGIEFIPLEERHSKPRDLAWVFIGAQFALGIILIGSLPIAFGLGYVGSVTSIMVGTFLGSLIYAPSAFLGPKTGTNTAVASGAFFGVRGRVLGSIIALFTGLGFAVIDIFTAGQVLVFGFHRYFGTSTGQGALAIALIAVTALTVLLGIYGHATLLWAYKVVCLTSALVMIAAVFVLLPHFHAVHSGGELLGGFWSTWVLAMTIAASLPLSYQPFVNDYARYIPPDASRTKLVAYNGIGMFFGTCVAMLIGATVAACFSSTSTPFAEGIVAVSPAAFLVPLMYVALTGDVANAALSVYNAGLDLQSYFWRIRRVVIAVGVGLLLTVVAYLSVVVFNESSEISSFLSIMLLALMPWLVIMLIGDLWRRGNYKPLDLHSYARPENRGIYWFWKGVDPWSLGAWALGTALGFMFVDQTLYVGPWAGSLDGVDVSWIIGGVVSGVVYAVELWIRDPKKVGATR
jgi:purine-cytosine permease-like protein